MRSPPPPRAWRAIPPVRRDGTSEIRSESTVYKLTVMNEVEHL